MKLFIFDMGGVLARDFDVLPEAARLLGMPKPSLRDIAALDAPRLLA